MSALPGNCEGVLGCARGGIGTKSLCPQEGLWLTVFIGFCVFKKLFLWRSSLLNFLSASGWSFKDGHLCTHWALRQRNEHSGNGGVFYYSILPNCGCVLLRNCHSSHFSPLRNLISQFFETTLLTEVKCSQIFISDSHKNAKLVAQNKSKKLHGFTQKGSTSPPFQKGKTICT